jgi:hypothetical protein
MVKYNPTSLGSLTPAVTGREASSASPTGLLRAGAVDGFTDDAVGTAIALSDPDRLDAVLAATERNPRATETTKGFRPSAGTP